MMAGHPQMAPRTPKFKVAANDRSLDDQWDGLGSPNSSKDEADAAVNVGGQGELHGRMRLDAVLKPATGFDDDLKAPADKERRRSALEVHNRACMLALSRSGVGNLEAVPGSEEHCSDDRTTRGECSEYSESEAILVELSDAMTEIAVSNDDAGAEIRTARKVESKARSRRSRIRVLQRSRRSGVRGWVASPEPDGPLLLICDGGIDGYRVILRC